MFFSVEENINYFKEKLNNNFDVTSRIIHVGESKLGMLFIKSLMDKESLILSIMAPLIDYKGKNVTFDELEKNVLKIFELERVDTDEDVIIK